MIERGTMRQEVHRSVFSIVPVWGGVIPDGAFDVEEMERDVTLYQTLRPLTLALTQLQELVDDTTLAAGSEAYTAALLVYQYAKVSNFA